MFKKRSMKILCCVFAIMSVLSCVALACGASDVTPGQSAINDMKTNLQTALSDFSASNLATIIVFALSLTVGLALAWFAYRFVVRKISAAMKKGRVG